MGEIAPAGPAAWAPAEGADKGAVINVERTRGGENAVLDDDAAPTPVTA